MALSFIPFHAMSTQLNAPAGSTTDTITAMLPSCFTLSTRMFSGRNPTSTSFEPEMPLVGSVRRTPFQSTISGFSC